MMMDVRTFKIRLSLAHRTRGVSGGFLRALVPCLVVVASFTGAIVGCSDKDRRLSEGEALRYKGQLIRRGELSAGQVETLGSDTRRTRREIDSVYEKLRTESREQQAKERAFWENELRRRPAANSFEP